MFAFFKAKHNVDLLLATFLCAVMCVRFLYLLS